MQTHYCIGLMGSLMPAGGNNPPRWPCILRRPPQGTHLMAQPGSLRKDSTLESWSRDWTASPLLGSDLAWGSEWLRKLHPHLCVATRGPSALWPPLVPAPLGLLSLVCSSQYIGCGALCCFFSTTGYAVRGPGLDGSSVWYEDNFALLHVLYFNKFHNM